ncbi:MAG: cyclase family protein [Desulfomonilaceae bacterium]
MVIHDLSLPVSEALVVWPGDPTIHITQPSHLDKGDKATVSRLDMGAHTGTHVDAPCHFIRGGLGIDSLDLNTLVGPALVVETSENGNLTADSLEGFAIPPRTRRVLFRTRNSELWSRGEHSFSKDFVGITAEGAQWLVDFGVRLVGVDYLSVAPFGQSGPTHQTLLHAGVIIVEGLNMSGVGAGVYTLVCLPLKLVGIDGSPARAILIEVNRE